ncbi:MAG: hypothetical protein ACTSSG_13160 [Candidatus Heimdallarchaeaceae archaeon]
MKPLLLSIKKKKELQKLFTLFHGFDKDIKKLVERRILLNHPYDFFLPPFSQELDEVKQAQAYELMHSKIFLLEV